MNRTNNFSVLSQVFILLILTFSLPFNAHGDKGRIYFSNEDIKVSEDAQKAIILHNLEEEVLILGTDLKADKKIGVIMFIPFPSEPKVSLAPDNAFEKAAAMIKKYGLKYLNVPDLSGGKGGPASTTTEGVELRFNKKLGAHDLTVIKVNDVSTFRQWVNNFFKSKKLPLKETYPKEEAIVDDYVKRGIIYFVLDFVEVLDETRFIEPVMYKFKSRELYYPLKTSNTFGGAGIIELIIMAPTTLFAPEPRPYDFYDFGLNFPNLNKKTLDTPYAKGSQGIIFPVRASTSALIVKEEEDIEEICPEGESFFKDQKAFIQVIRYMGEYDFTNDIFIDVLKGLPSAIGADEEGQGSPWEQELWISPSDKLDRINRKKCLLKPERGPCKGNFKRYYYDSLSNECKEFLWGGCGGVVPFETKEECEKCKGNVNPQETGLHRAAVAGNIHTAELLIAKGADINAKNNDGKTPLHKAAYYNSKEVSELLIARGADVNAKDEHGATPLHEAALNSAREVAELLIAKSADVNAKNDYGDTPLDVAKKEYKLYKSQAQKKIVDLLKKHGAK